MLLLLLPLLLLTAAAAPTEADYNDYEDLPLWQHQSNVSACECVFGGGGGVNRGHSAACSVAVAERPPAAYQHYVLTVHLIPQRKI